MSQEQIQVLNIAPIHGGALEESIQKRLHPDYVAFYNQNLLGKPQVQERPPRHFRMPDGASYIPGMGELIKVGRRIDMDVPRKYTDPSAPPVNIRVFWPEGPRPADGKLPCFFHIHGGGWVLGSKGSELHQCTRFCSWSRSIVVTADYRLAPEDPFPAAVEDCWEVLQWLVADARAEDGGVLGIDDKRIAIGGASAGGNLAATLSHMLFTAPHAPKDFQPKLLLLTIPAVDFTAADSASGSKTWGDYPSWKQNEHAPALPAAKLMWYRNLYLPKPADRHNWHASPIFAPEENFKRLPPTIITTADCDPLRDEGLVYFKKCEKHGVKVTYKNYEGMPHPAISQDALLKDGAVWLKYLTDSLKEAFWGSQ